MRVFRLCKRINSDTVLSGEGGLAAEGRWHSAGRRIVYTASSEALTVLEMRVHVGRFIPKAAYVMHEMEIPDAQIRVREAGMLEKRWNALPLPKLPRSASPPIDSTTGCLLRPPRPGRR
jgi:RES domain-containing protein